jgi:dinuclear metal center YbgI/SA1388 family protein
MIIADVLKKLEEIAPARLAQKWDNVGLINGDEKDRVKNVLLTVDITDEVADEAKSRKCELIISYHPVIFEPLKKITASGDKPVVFRLLKNSIASCALHTSLDAVQGGVNDALAEMIGLENTSPIGEFIENPLTAKMYKFAVFIPLAYVNSVSKAIFGAGAGRLGNYSECGFTTEGIGSFRPLNGASPAIGKTGTLEQVEEYRFETVVREENLSAVIAAMKSAHPYEMPAYDVISLEAEAGKFGIGRSGTLAKSLALSEILRLLSTGTGCKTAGIIAGKRGKYRKAAVCAGSCGNVIREAAAGGAEIYITGELKHHDALYAQQAGLTCVCLSHSVSERFMLSRLKKTLPESFPGLNFYLSRKDKDPFNWKQI